MKLSDKINHVVNSYIKTLHPALTLDPLTSSGNPKKAIWQWACSKIYKLNKENEAMKRLIALYKLQDKKRDKQLKERFNKPPFVNNVTVETPND